MILFALAAVAASSALPPLSDFAGAYEDGSNAPVEIVAGDSLFAVLDEAKYPLAVTGPDTVRNPGGQTVTFRRENGRVTGYVEGGTFHRRISATVSPASQALAWPRPPGSGPYVYRRPQDLHDGIPVGDIADTALGRATAERIGAGILSGEWKDVHGILLFKDG